jgi:hypothetical protein
MMTSGQSLRLRDAFRTHSRPNIPKAAQAGGKDASKVGEAIDAAKALASKVG